MKNACFHFGKKRRDAKPRKMDASDELVGRLTLSKKWRLAIREKSSDVISVKRQRHKENRGRTECRRS